MGELFHVPCSIIIFYIHPDRQNLFYVAHKSISQLYYTTTQYTGIVQNKDNHLNILDAVFDARLVA